MFLLVICVHSPDVEIKALTSTITVILLEGHDLQQHQHWTL